MSGDVSLYIFISGLAAHHPNILDPAVVDNPRYRTHSHVKARSREPEDGMMPLPPKPLSPTRIFPYEDLTESRVTDLRVSLPHPLYVCTGCPTIMPQTRLIPPSCVGRPPKNCGSSCTAIEPSSRKPLFWTLNSITNDPKPHVGYESCDIISTISQKRQSCTAFPRPADDLLGLYSSRAGGVPSTCPIEASSHQGWTWRADY